jgi:hypothetical protein
MTKDSLERQLRRHSINFRLRCDLIDRTGRAWPVTMSSSDEFFIGLLLVTPHSDGGRKLCAALNKDDVVRYRLGLNIFDARVATKDSDRIWLHAVDIIEVLILPVWVPDPHDPRFADTVKKERLANG